MATSHCFNGFWRLTRLSPTTTAESEHDVHVAVIALYRHYLQLKVRREYTKNWLRCAGVGCGVAPKRLQETSNHDLRTFRRSRRVEQLLPALPHLLPPHRAIETFARE